IRKVPGSPGTRADMCVAMMSVQPKWSTTRYSAARSQRACHSAALMPEGWSLAVAVIFASLVCPILFPWQFEVLNRGALVLELKGMYQSAGRAPGGRQAGRCFASDHDPAVAAARQRARCMADRIAEQVAVRLLDKRTPG